MQILDFRKGWGEEEEEEDAHLRDLIGFVRWIASKLAKHLMKITYFGGERGSGEVHGSVYDNYSRTFLLRPPVGLGSSRLYREVLSEIADVCPYLYPHFKSDVKI